MNCGCFFFCMLQPVLGFVGLYFACSAMNHNLKGVIVLPGDWVLKFLLSCSWRESCSGIAAASSLGTGEPWHMKGPSCVCVCTRGRLVVFLGLSSVDPCTRTIPGDVSRFDKAK